MSNEMDTKYMSGDVRAIIGAYKSDNLTDSDEIYYKQQEILKAFSTISNVTNICLVVFFLFFLLFASIAGFWGGVIALVFFIPLGVLPALFSIRTQKNKKAAFETATSKYCKEVGVNLA